MEVTTSFGSSGPGHYYSDVATVGNFLDVFGDYHSTDDPFELVGQGGGVTSWEVLPEVSSHLLKTPPHIVPELLPELPSEDEMAEWLRGEGYAADQPSGNAEVAGHMDDQPAPAKSMGNIPEKWDKEELHNSHAFHQHKRSSDFTDVVKNSDNVIAGNPSENITCNSSERSKTAAGARRSHCPETHGLEEKRRRCRLNEKFRTLQQLVPGCDKSCTQAATLDRTIQYMKSLQQQLQDMSVVGCSMLPAAAVFPFIERPSLAAVPAWMFSGVPPVIPFAGPPMLPLVHHPAVMV